MFRTFPRFLFKERSIILSYPELKMRIGEGIKLRKQIVVSLYAFQEIKDRQPLEESVIIDCYLFHGNEGNLENLAIDLQKKGVISYLFFDGKEDTLLSNIASTKEELENTHEFDSYGVRLNRNINKMIVFPGTVNLESGKKAEIKKVFK